MPIDYLADFPIPAALLPQRLQDLLAPVGLSARQQVEVACHDEVDPHGENSEHVHLLMAVVAEDGDGPLPVLDEAGNGVVEHSVPMGDRKACIREFSPSLSGHDYVVASWGDGSFYTFNLAEKVWMALGLTPRCVGSEAQRMIYDDLGLPEFGAAQGEVSSEYQWTLKRKVSWKMTNEYLRRYLWMRGARGVRAFYYETQLQDLPELRALMGGDAHVELEPNEGVIWYQVELQEHRHGLLLQVWASVEAVSCELCPELSADGIAWPDVDGLMTHERANAMIHRDHVVYLDDRFLEKYEQNSAYDTTPVWIDGICSCSPSYKGQWSFTDCRRVGRNLVRVSIRELYKPKPDREILHARQHALSAADVAHLDLEAEHVVRKVQRLLQQLLDLGERLSRLGEVVGLRKTAVELIGFSREELAANGWLSYPNLARLAQVVPLNMTEQAFLARCKSMHELWQRVPNGFLRSLLEKAGCPKAAINPLASLKLLEALLNIVQRLNSEEEALSAFAGKAEEGWNSRNETMAALFLNNDLRISDAHESIEKHLATLQLMGFDTAHVNDGYGKALDFVMDLVIGSFGSINQALGQLLAR